MAETGPTSLATARLATVHGVKTKSESCRGGKRFITNIWGSCLPLVAPVPAVACVACSRLLETDHVPRGVPTTLGRSSTIRRRPRPSSAPRAGGSWRRRAARASRATARRRATAAQLYRRFTWFLRDRAACEPSGRQGARQGRSRRQVRPPSLRTRGCRGSRALAGCRISTLGRLRSSPVVPWSLVFFFFFSFFAAPPSRTRR